MFAISPTDNLWFNFLKSNAFNSYVNFWTPTPWNVKGLKEGDRLYFMLKKPIRKIGGFGEFVSYKNMTAEDIWDEFGFRNGCSSKENLFKTLDNYIHRNSKSGKQENLHGCIILKNCEFWDSEKYVEFDGFPNQVVTIKYFFDQDPFIISENFYSLIAEPREDYKIEMSSRKGQGSFKGKILKAYRNTCSVTGENIPEILEAAHIQSYKNIDSNHVQNGILLRVDIHRLFDNHLLCVGEDYKVKISSLLKDTIYWQYNGVVISLPSVEALHPSKEALLERLKSFRR